MRRLLALAALACVCLAAETRTLTILHTNDVHARLSPAANGRGGFAYLAATIRRERANCSDCILLNAGDLVQGSPVSTLFHGLPIFQIANLFGYDAATLGNHDFDYGWMQTRKFIETANYPIVSANLVGAHGEIFAPKPYVILKVNGLRVAVIGAMTDDLDSLSTPKLLGPWRTAPALAAVRRYAAELKDQSDLVVLLAHITGGEEEVFLAGAPEVPVTVTGHIHTGLREAETRDGRVLVRTAGYGEELGRLELSVDVAKKNVASWKWKRVAVNTSSVAPAPDVAREVKRWEDEVTKRVDQPLAVARRAFDKAAVRLLIEQSMRDETGADFAFMNLGGVRDALPEGQLLVRHIWNVMPFDNVVVVGRFKGKDLPAAVLAGRKVDPEREYTLAVSDFTAANQGDPSQLGKTGLVFPNEAGLMRDMIVDWCRKKKVLE